ncbi:MAG: CocE/NonD family hydrolase [bacterium]
MRVISMVLFAVAAAGAQSPDSVFTRVDTMIPMRDGVHLHTTVYVPKRLTGPLPMLFERTPYFADRYYRPGLAALGADDGYIYVLQDIRGRASSEGRFVMDRPPLSRAQRANAKAIDEVTDAYDTIDWLVKNVPNNNGRVGMFGVSYDGWLAAITLIDPHPALRAISPQASPADMWLNDDTFHNGALRLAMDFEFAAMMESGNDDFHYYPFDTYDMYEWYLKLGPLSNVDAKYAHGKLPSWTEVVEHPTHAYWRQKSIVPSLTKVTVPTLNVAGWWDQEDFVGAVTIYQALEQYDTQNKNFLVVGPWFHGGWERGEGRRILSVDFGMAASAFFRDSIELPFFDFYLKDKGVLKQPEALLFETGSGKWRAFDAWPPKNGVAPRTLYFGENGTLSFTPPIAKSAFDSYVSDPQHPVPYRHRPIQANYDPRGSGWSAWLLEDQRFVTDRADVLVWRTEPLAEDVTIAGEVIAKLFASTSGTDGDWIVKLIDVYPETMPTEARMGGYELMVSNDVFRARYLKDGDKPQPLIPGKVTPIAFSLHTQNYRFKKGHRIMVHVQSSWFPLIDRNPQKFLPSIFDAKETDYQSAMIKVFRSSGSASGIVLPIVTSPSP